MTSLTIRKLDPKDSGVISEAFTQQVGISASIRSAVIVRVGVLWPRYKSSLKASNNCSSLSATDSHRRLPRVSFASLVQPLMLERRLLPAFD
ncbi:MAG: hypothetical protein DMF63_00735 [Acidobacteria bacterium]|nr:MAG: hypothetical protein DMF63_00735 [Acidobacteriota bacterium]